MNLKLDMSYSTITKSLISSCSLGYMSFVYTNPVWNNLFDVSRFETISVLLFPS